MMNMRTIIWGLFFLIIVCNARTIPGRVPILMAYDGEQDRDHDYARRLRNHWTCKFEHNFCNFRNQYNMATFHRSTSTLFGQNSMLFLNTSNAGNYQGARLQSDYFATNSQLDACLTINYLMYGIGAAKMYLIQQDIANKCIWVDNHDTVDNYGQWREVNLSIDLRDGSPRFFIEAHIRPRYQGIIAISQVSFAYGLCPYNNANYCHVDEEPHIIGSIPQAV